MSLPIWPRPLYHMGSPSWRQELRIFTGRWRRRRRHGPHWNLLLSTPTLTTTSCMPNEAAKAAIVAVWQAAPEIPLVVQFTQQGLQHTWRLGPMVSPEEKSSRKRNSTRNNHNKTSISSPMLTITTITKSQDPVGQG